MINLLYCIDENYNEQLLTSLNSILDNLNTKINLYIIHENPKSFEGKKEIIFNNPKINEIHVTKFDDLNYSFPKIEDSHVSKATYFRMYISQHIDSKVDRILYVDPDVVCINSFQNNYSNIFEQMDQKFTIGVYTASTLEDHNKLMFKELNIKEKYFNAGVMFINLKKWREDKITDALIDTMDNIKESIQYWDQDVLNSYFDGDYFEIQEKFNFIVYSKKRISELDEDEVVFIHYAGTNKPWYLESGINKISKYYQNQYFKYNDNYHINIKNTKNSIFALFKGVINLELFFMCMHPLKYLIQAIKKIFKIKLVN